MRQWTGPSSVQIMACRLFGAKPLPEPMLVYCQLDSWEHISVKLKSEFYHFHLRKCILKCPGGGGVNEILGDLCIIDWHQTTTKQNQSRTACTLQWRQNGHDGVSNHQPHDCLLNHLFMHRSKKILKLRVTGLCEGNSPETGEYPAQRPVTRKMFPFDGVIMIFRVCTLYWYRYTETEMSFWRNSGTYCVENFVKTNIFCFSIMSLDIHGIQLNKYSVRKM